MEDSVKILVTGNLGYIGSHLTDILVNAGHEVTGIDLELYPQAQCGSLTKPNKQLKSDFRKITGKELSRIDTVLHLGGLSNDPTGELNAGLTSSINGQGTEYLAKMAKKNGVKRFIFASSCSIYGSQGQKPRLEDDETNPLTEYAASKLYAEKQLMKLNDKDFETYILRNATAYGSSKVMRQDLVINELTAKMKINGTAKLNSNGNQWRPFIHAHDMARVFAHIAENPEPKISGKPINIGSNNENYQIKDVCEIIEGFFPNQNISISNQSINDPRDYRVDFTLFEKTYPKFNFDYKLAEGIRDLISHYANINYSKQEIDKNRYIRISELRDNLTILQSQFQ